MGNFKILKDLDLISADDVIKANAEGKEVKLIINGDDLGNRCTLINQKDKTATINKLNEHGEVYVDKVNWCMADETIKADSLALYFGDKLVLSW